ncbi:predicted protein [Histoplasma capsulatum G186AR]|uniref:Uncharacterized protein n=1 Tax=Ajellomyces capsulatus (strain G186AR / H82 / ATCC MYA-2454 / RMSCC 2432) TaxID=447093 RepID=C0NHP5_AJECG|nr:uncharacterized protein HCBG_02867 [Histoplasma capsulatum G186AR]EEH09330.1 predicted protein [Histoplasma capsulatum G186AR]
MASRNCENSPHASNRRWYGCNAPECYPMPDSGTSGNPSSDNSESQLVIPLLVLVNRTNAAKTAASAYGAASTTLYPSHFFHVPGRWPWCQLGGPSPMATTTQASQAISLILI